MGIVNGAFYIAQSTCCKMGPFSMVEQMHSNQRTGCLWVQNTCSTRSDLGVSMLSYHKQAKQALRLKINSIISEEKRSSFHASIDTFKLLHY